MYNHSLFELLKSFSKEEINKLSDFIRSPYFYKGRRLRVLYEELIQYYPLFTHENLNKKYLFKKVNGNDRYNDSTMRNLMNRLQLLVFRFLVLEKFNKMKFINEDYLLKELALKNQAGLFKKNINKIEKSLNELNKINTEYYQKRYLLESNKYNYNVLASSILKKPIAEKEFTDLSHGSLNQFLFFITEILNTYISIHSQKDKFDIKDYENPLCKFIDSIDLEKIVTDTKMVSRNFFLVEIYFSMYKAFRFFNNEKYYYEYKRLLVRNSTKLSIDENTEHFTNLINYCISKNRSTKKRKIFRPELMTIYELILKKEFYNNDKVTYLPKDLFRNVLLLAIRERDFQWILNFLRKYTPKINSRDRENMINYGYSFLYHVQGDYDKSLAHIDKVKKDNFNYQFDLNNLSLHNYFELNDFDKAFKLIHAYQESLKYNEMLSDERKTRHFNFLYYFEKILSAKSGNTRIDLDFLKYKLKKCDQILYKEWLLDKIAVIEKGVVKVV